MKGLLARKPAAAIFGATLFNQIVIRVAYTKQKIAGRLPTKSNGLSGDIKMNEFPQQRTKFKMPPMWPYRLTQLTFIVLLIIEIYLINHWYGERFGLEEWANAGTVAFFLAMIGASIAQSFYDALANAYQDAVDKRERYNFILMMATMSTFVVTAINLCVLIAK